MKKKEKNKRSKEVELQLHALASKYMRAQNEKKIQKGSEIDKKEIHQYERKKGRVYEGVYEGGKRRKRRRNMICWK